MNKSEQKAKQEKMYGLIEKWQESGLPKQLFCDQHTIAYHVFYYYFNKYHGIKKKRKNIQSKQAFLPVKLTSPQLSLPPIEIIYPNGVSVKCAALPSSNQLRELINIF